MMDSEATTKLAEMDEWVECICGADIHTVGDEWLDRSGGAFCYPIGVGDDSMVTHEPNEVAGSSDTGGGD